MTGSKRPSMKELEGKLDASGKALEEMQAEKQATEELLHEAQEKEAEYKRQLEVAEARAAEAQAIIQAQAAVTAAATTTASELIERPHGSFSLPAILQQHGILSDEQLAIHQFIHGYLGMLQEKKWFNHQDPEQLAAIRDAASQAFPALQKFRDRWPVTKMIQDCLRNRRVELTKMGMLEKSHRNYKTTHEQRSMQSKHANTVSVHNRRERIAETTAIRRQEEGERDVEHGAGGSSMA